VTTGRTRRAALRGAGTLLAGSWLAGCAGGGDGGNEDGNTVEMTDALAFEPADIAIDAGGNVVWVNGGSVTHTVTAYADRISDGAAYFASGGFDSERAARDAYPPYGGLEADVSYRHTFRTPGSYEYVCLPHESAGMTGTITVREG